MIKKNVMKKHSRHAALLTAIVLAFSNIGTCLNVSLAQEITSEGGSDSTGGSGSSGESNSSGGSNSTGGSSSSGGSNSSSGSDSSGGSNSSSGSDSTGGSDSSSGNESGEGTGSEGEGGETAGGESGEGTGSEGEGGETAGGESGEGTGNKGESAEDSGIEGEEDVNGETGGVAGGGAAAGDLADKEEKEKEFTITYTVNPEGAAEVEGDTLIQEGEELSFTVKPVDGYVIQIVTANGYELAAEAEEDTEGDSGLAGMATYVVTDIEENLDIEVELLETEETASDTAAFMAEIDGITILVEPLDGEFAASVKSLSAIAIDDEDTSSVIKGKCAADGYGSVEVRVFDITLEDENGQPVQPGCNVKVSFSGLDIPKSVSNERSVESDKISVYHLEDQENDLKVNDLKCDVNEGEGTVAFETSHFSVFAIAYPDGNEFGHRYVPTSYLSSSSTFEYRNNSEYIVIDTTNSTLNQVQGGYDLTVDAAIAEDAEGPLTFVLSDAFMEAMRKFGADEGVMPTYKFNLNLNLKNNSQIKYLYEANSLSVQTPESNVDTSFSGMDVTIKGFDGQIIDRTYGAYRVQNNAIKDLFGKTKINFEDMLTIYDVLYEKGYDGDYPLTDYYKNYYHTDDLSTVFGNLSMESVGNNGTFDLSGTIDEVAAKYDGTYPYFDFANIFTSKSKLKARLYEVEPELGSLLYDTFYKELFGVTFGERTGYDTPLALFMDHDTSEWQSADASFADTLGDGLSSGESCDFTLGMFFHPRMGNAYQGYNCGYYAAITLVPENTTPPTPPTPPNPPTPPTPPSGGGTSGGGGGTTPGGHRATPDTNGPGVTIEPEAVPLAPLPEGVTIEPGEVPLAHLPKTGQNPMAQWVCLMSGLMLGLYGFLGRKREEDG